MLFLLQSYIPTGAKLDVGKLRNEIDRQAERREMKLSEQLAKQLEATIAMNNAMTIVNNNLLQQNSNLLGVVNEIQGKATVVPEKKKMDDDKKALLLQRLAEGKKRKQEEEAARKKEMAKRMAKARKGKGK